MIGKVLQDSFQDLRICIDLDEYKPSPLSTSSSSGRSPVGSSSGRSPVSSLGRSPVGSLGESLLSRDCQESIWGSPSPPSTYQTPTKQLIEPSKFNSNSTQQPSSRYKTEMCRPYQDEGVCKYGEKCQFAHGAEELRSVNRHPKYKTDLCKTYHKKGFCPYGPRCHFIHDLVEYQQNSQPSPKKTNEIKQLPMFGGQDNTWSFPSDMNKDMKHAVVTLNSFFNVNNRQNSLNSSDDSSYSSRSGSFCSDLDSPSSPAPSVSPTPIGAPRLPIFSRLA